MHLEVTKDNKWRNGEGKNVFSKKLFSKKNVFPRNFCHQILYHMGPRLAQEADECHGCIRNEFLMRVGTHEIFQLNDMSKIWQKHDFGP